MTDVFADKIKFSSIIVNKELDLIEVFTQVQKELNMGVCELDHTEQSLAFVNAWLSLSQLYNILKYDYVPKIDKKGQTELKNLVEKWGTQEKTTYQELKQAFDIILKVMSKNKFHDVLRNAEKLSPLTKYKKDKGLSAE